MPGRLTGTWLPPIALPSTSGALIDLSELDRAVLYAYPGSSCSPEDGHRSQALDEVQHRAFSDHWPDFLALNCRVLGLSSQPLDDQSVVAAALGIGHPLLCDQTARVARELGLATFSGDGIECYHRLTLVVNEGTILEAFYPLTSAVRSAAQVVAWMRYQRN